MNISEIRLSVAIGTFNRIDMVRQAIEAALSQTLMPYEIIVYDDCSPDRTYEILSKEYEDNSIVKFYYQEKNTGGVPNWNAAINKCSGEYIAWCSDDDRFFEWHLEKSIEYLERNPNVSLVHSAFATHFEYEKEPPFEEINESIIKSIDLHSSRSIQPIIIKGQEILPYYTKYYSWPFHPSTLVFKKEVWQKIGEFNNRYELADSEWFIRVAIQYTVAYLPHLGVLNRRHKGNWSNAMGSIKMQLEVNEMMKGFISNMNDEAPSIGLDWNTLKWKLNYKSIMSRIFVSRVRHGMMDVAEEAKKALKNDSIFFRILLNDISVPVIYKILRFFRKEANFDLSPK